MDLSSIHKSAIECLNLIEHHGANMKWFNIFCGKFLRLTENLHTLLLNSAHCLNVEVIFLCLHQICNCMKYMELAIKLAEQSSTGHVQMTPIQHFSDRIQIFLVRLCSALDHTAEAAREVTFCDLMDTLLDYLEPYEAGDEHDDHLYANDNSTYINKFRSMMDDMLGQTLTFANIALDDDKRALGALCQQVFRECMNFQKECQLIEREKKLRPNCKLVAASLMNALYKIEDYINKTLLRMIYICFLGYEKFSIEKLRTMQLCGNIDERTLDEFIADFDVNLDRTTQIGVFANAFASNVKTKTIVRSALASFESLDSFLIPAVLSKPCERLITVDILEQHFNEEVTSFKNAIQEIIDSYAFTICFKEQVDQCILLTEKDFCKNNLENIVDMGQILCEHFEVKSNRIQLENDANLLQYFDKFKIILRECAAILVCCKQVDQQRILKRFKILRSVVGKFVELLYKSTMSQSIIDYEQNNITSLDVMLSTERQTTNTNMNLEELPSTIAKFTTPARVNRRESLRTKIFKRKKLEESVQVDSACSINETSFLMSEILNQLTLLSNDSHVMQHTK